MNTRRPSPGWTGRPGLADLLNIGPKSAAWLAEAGIRSPAGLRRRGAVAAYLAVKRRRPAASLNLLYALAGAIDGLHWRTVRRDHRLTLLAAVEDAGHGTQRAATMRRGRPALARADAPGADDPRGGGQRSAGRPDPQASVRILRNVGPATARDLSLLGILTVGELARRDALRLYRSLERRTGQRQDPCVRDVFAAAIHQARTGEACDWWAFTARRKRSDAAAGTTGRGGGRGSAPRRSAGPRSPAT